MLIVRQLADALMVTGQRVADIHQASALGDRLVTFYPPVDTDVFRPDAAQRERAREQLGLGVDDFLVGTVGNINPQKRHGHFIRAAHRLRQDLPNARFVILGAKSPNHSKHVAAVLEDARRAGLRLGSDLVLLDPEENVQFWARAIDVFWLTSGKRSEGISTAVEEAMALGIPVVSTDVGSLREAVCDGETGYIVPADDPNQMATATARLARDSELRLAMGAASRLVATKRFGITECVDAHVRAFEIAEAHSLVNRR